MQSKIRVLSEQTINQIAAGEVIENPSSVVKELVENAIDAEAKEIRVEIIGGGRNLIRVTDDGFGMNKDDALLCLERHATSKIKNAEDIQSILTMGFRGEAIPSIASISKFSLLTKAKDEDKGTHIVVDGGKLIQCSAAVRSTGTTIEVKSLFFNVPVRKKFQKSPTYDANEILKIMSLIALSNPSLKFELISNEKKILSALPQKNLSDLDVLKTRISCILGDDFTEALCPVNGNLNGYHIQGFIGLPHTSRQNRTGQYLFINQRAIQSPLVSFAVRDGYGTTLPTARHPIFVLHLTLPTDLVDVNVHPQKREVRLRQEQQLRELVSKSIEKALQEIGFTKDVFFEPQSYTFVNPNQEISPFSLTNKSSINHPFSPPELEEQQKTVESFIYKPIYEAPKKQIPDFFLNEHTEINIKVLNTISHFILLDPNDLQIKNKKPDALLCLVDQKKAKARILFESLTKNQKIISSPLLIPYTFETTLTDSEAILTEIDALNSMGIEIHQSGNKQFIVSALPDFFKIRDVESFILKLIEEFKEENVIQKEKMKKIASYASFAASSLNKLIHMEEAKSLIDQLMKCEMPYQCPKGKPIFGFLNKDELMKFF